MQPVELIVPWNEIPVSLFETNELGDLFPVQSRFDQVYAVVGKLYERFKVANDEVVDVEIEFGGDPYKVEDVSLLIHLVLYMLWRGNVIESRGMKNLRSIKCTLVEGDGEMSVKVSE